MGAAHRSKRAQGLAGWNPSDDAQVIIDQVQQVLQEYSAQLPMTGRQIGAFISDYGVGYADEVFEPERIAVTVEQAEDFDLDSAPPKPTDTRSVGWEGETYQVEAMTPTQLAGVVEDAILRYYDEEARGELVFLSGLDDEI